MLLLVISIINLNHLLIVKHFDNLIMCIWKFVYVSKCKTKWLDIKTNQFQITKSTTKSLHVHIVIVSSRHIHSIFTLIGWFGRTEQMMRLCLEHDAINEQFIAAWWSQSLCLTHYYADFYIDKSKLRCFVCKCLYRRRHHLVAVCHSINLLKLCQQSILAYVICVFHKIAINVSILAKLETARNWSCIANVSSN